MFMTNKAMLWPQGRIQDFSRGAVTGTVGVTEPVEHVPKMLQL